MRLGSLVAALLLLAAVVAAADVAVYSYALRVQVKLSPSVSSSGVSVLSVELCNPLPVPVTVEGVRVEMVYAGKLAYEAYTSETVTIPSHGCVEVTPPARRIDATTLAGLAARLLAGEPVNATVTVQLGAPIVGVAVYAPAVRVWVTRQLRAAVVVVGR